MNVIRYLKAGCSLRVALYVEHKFGSHIWIFASQKLCPLTITLGNNNESNFNKLIKTIKLTCPLAAGYITPTKALSPGCTRRLLAYTGHCNGISSLNLWAGRKAMFIGRDHAFHSMTLAVLLCCEAALAKHIYMLIYIDFLTTLLNVKLLDHILFLFLLADFFCWKPYCDVCLLME